MLLVYKINMYIKVWDMVYVLTVELGQATIDLKILAKSWQRSGSPPKCYAPITKLVRYSNLSRIGVDSYPQWARQNLGKGPAGFSSTVLL